MYSKLFSRFVITALLIVILSVLCIHAYCGTPPYPAVYTDKISTTPDLLQTDSEANFTDNGAHYGAPVSASNFLTALGNSGFCRLCPRAQTQKQSQIAMVHTLALPGFMTTSEDGSNPTEFIQGVKKYVTDADYRCVKLEYQGWRPLSEKLTVSSAIPSLEWMKEIISNPAGGLCVNVGFYAYSRESKTFNRIGGHWITVVGYGIDEKGNSDPYTFVIHDPSRRDGKSTHHAYCQLWPINDGSVLAGAKGLPISANGYYTVPKGLNIPKGSDIAVVDCAIGLIIGK